MAKEKKPAAWKTETVATINIGKGTKWCAQVSTAPDGKEFIGLRKYAIKADGTELATKDGFGLINDGTAGGHLSNILSVLTTLSKSKRISWKAGKHPEAVEAKKAKKAEAKAATGGKKKKSKGEEEEDPIYCLMNDDGMYYVSHRVTDDDKVKVKKTEDEEEGTQFGTKEEAETCYKRMKKAGVKSSWEVKRWN